MNPKPTTPAELRESLGMSPHQMMTNARGELADILQVEGDNVTLGIIGTGEVLTVPLSKFRKEKPE